MNQSYVVIPSVTTLFYYVYQMSNLIAAVIRAAYIEEIAHYLFISNPHNHYKSPFHCFPRGMDFLTEIITY